MDLAAQERDLISRQAVIEYLITNVPHDDYGCELDADEAREMWTERINSIPSAEPEVFEWCDTCKEYDREKHCCHRFSKVIRQAFKEMKVVHCIDCRHSEYDEVYGDRYCHYNGKAEVVDDYHYCRDGERRDDEDGGGA